MLIVSHLLCIHVLCTCVGAVIIAAVVYYGRQWSLENAICAVLYPGLILLVTSVYVYIGKRGVRLFYWCVYVLFPSLTLLKSVSVWCGLSPEDISSWCSLHSVGECIFSVL